MIDEQIERLYEANKQLFDSFEEFSRVVKAALGFTVDSLEQIYKDVEIFYRRK